MRSDCVYQYNLCCSQYCNYSKAPQLKLMPAAHVHSCVCVLNEDDGDWVAQRDTCRVQVSVRLVLSTARLGLTTITGKGTRGNGWSSDRTANMSWPNALSSASWRVVTTCEETGCDPPLRYRLVRSLIALMLNVPHEIWS